MKEFVRDEIVKQITVFLSRETNYHDPSLISEHTQLLESGIMDSLMTMSLLAYCEQAFECHIQPEELSEENLESAGSIADLILRMRSTHN